MLRFSQEVQSQAGAAVTMADPPGHQEGGDVVYSALVVYISMRAILVCSKVNMLKVL